MTTRAQLQASLSFHDPAVLRAILDAAGVRDRGADTSDALAQRIVDAMWWCYSTPLGYAADRASFEDIVQHVARKLRVADRVDAGADAWAASTQLTHALLQRIPPEGVRVEDLDADTQRRLGASWLPTALLGTGATGSFGARFASSKVLGWLKTPVGRVLPLLPAVGPYIGGFKGVVSGVHLVSGPLGVALSVLALNQALGANYRKLVPLVLGVGALRPQSVDDAELVEE